MKKIIFAVLIILLASGCSVSKKERIYTDGSTSAEKVIGSLGEAYEILNENAVFTFNPTGSSAGIIALIDGRCDIGISSRNLTKDEQNQGLSQRVLAFDAISVIVNSNNPITNLTSEQIKKIFTGEITNWNDLGGAQGEIVIIGRESASGTREAFENAFGIKNKANYRQELTANGDIITSVKSNSNAIGYTSFAATKSNVKTISIDGILPSNETIKNNSYKISRPFVIVTKNKTKLNYAATDFLQFIFSQEAKKIVEAAGVVFAN